MKNTNKRKTFPIDHQKEEYLSRHNKIGMNFSNYEVYILNQRIIDINHHLTKPNAQFKHIEIVRLDHIVLRIETGHQNNFGLETINQYPKMSRAIRFDFTDYDSASSFLDGEWLKVKKKLKL